MHAHIISLPLEILEEIASLIELHSDLVSLALTCKVWNRLVIPAHTEYRIIRVRGKMFAMWAHLARRSDLARNIREIHLCEPDNYLSPDRYPTTLLSADQFGSVPVSKEDQRVTNMYEALMHMQRLEEFDWSWNEQTEHPTLKSVHEAQIFNALSHCKSLRRLRLSGPFGEHAMGVDRDPEGVFYPLWNVANLEALALEGGAWVRPQVAPHVRAMLSRSPNLHTLLFPLEFPFFSTTLPLHHAQPIFPHLHTLKLALQSGALPSIDARMLYFLSLHPTITDLEWFPLNGPINLPSGILPRLKRLVTYTRMGSGLLGLLDLEGVGRGALNCLSQISVHKKELSILEQQLHPARVEQSATPDDLADVANANDDISPSRSLVMPKVKLHLKKLRITRYDRMESLARLGALFPDLDWLFVQPQEKLDLEKWLSLLSSFPSLTTFLGGALLYTTDVQYPETQYTHTEMDSIIQRVARAAPQLREVDYWENEREDNEHEPAEWKYWRVIISRGGNGAQEEVTWERRVEESCAAWFDPLAQHFQ